METCTCCIGCFSTRQLPRYPKYSFPKKLLVAISLVVIIAMCVMPSEARNIEHKRRHKRPDNMAQPTKDTSTRLEAREHKRRHHKTLENLTQPTKEQMRRPKGSQAEIYIRETRKIVKKLRNTRRFLKDEKQQLNEIRDYREKMPVWLPTVNFIDIHYHDYKSSRARKSATTIPERKFTYLMPKLYKSLVEYEEIFKHLLNVELDFYDDPYNSYKTNRTKLLKSTLHKLYSTIQEVNDSMATVNVVVPPNKNKLDLSMLEKKVDATKCIKNDHLAFRGYKNLLSNWYLEFKCPRNGGKQAMKKQCKVYEAKLKERIEHKRNENRNNNKNVSIMSRVLSAT